MIRSDEAEDFEDALEDAREMLWMAEEDPMEVSGLEYDEERSALRFVVCVAKGSCRRGELRCYSNKEKLLSEVSDLEELRL